MPWRKKETEAFEDWSKSLFVLSDRGWAVSMCLKEKSEVGSPAFGPWWEDASICSDRTSRGFDF